MLEKMNSNDREKLKNVILREIESKKHQIESLSKSIKPVAPDNSIGRLTRMEAIGSKEIRGASLNSAQTKLAKLEAVLNKIDNPDFGICIRCSCPIPEKRIILMPESITCVACLEAEKD